MFFRNSSTYEGEPARLYRSPDKIREDIFDIKTKIELVNSQLNVRQVLTAMIDECAEGEPERWIPAMKGIIEEAGDTLAELNRLRDALEMLKYELEETKCALIS